MYDADEVLQAHVILRRWQPCLDVGWIAKRTAPVLRSRSLGNVELPTRSLSHGSLRMRERRV